MNEPNSSRSKMTPPSLARRWGISVDKVLTWIRSGELRAIDVSTRRGGRPRYLIDDADILAFERMREVQPPLRQTRRRRKPKDTSVIEFY